MKFLAAIRTKLAIVRTVAFFEVRFDLRLLRTWIFVAFALLIGVTNAIEQISLFTELSAVSSGTFMHSPLLSPVTIFPDFQVILTFGIVFFAIEIVSRDRSARMDEVIGTLPISNSQIVFGRALGLSGLLFLLFAAFLCLYVLFALLCDLAVPNLGFRPPEAYSMLATLFTDALPYVFFWTATVMFLTVLVRFRILAAVLAIMLMLLMYWLQNNAPMYLLNVLGTYSLSTQLPSELSPTFASTTIVLHRVALVLLAISLLFWTAYLLPRIDIVRTRLTAAVGVSVTILASVGFSFVHAQSASRLDLIEGWRALHAQFNDVPQIDIERLSGHVEIDPGSDLMVDFTIDVRLVRELQQDDSLVFSFNPGYEIDAVALDENRANFSFEGGLLRVASTRTFERSEELSLRIKARGSPDSRFAYLDAAIDPLNSDAVSAYGLFLLGSEPAINHSDYVALTPSIAWYPMAGPHLERNATSKRSRDYFGVSLEVVTPSEWHVGGPGKSSIETHAGSSTHAFAPSVPIHEVGLFAAPFERRTKKIAGINFELLVSPKHTKNLELFDPIEGDIEAYVEEWLEFSRSRGFNFPLQDFTIVETPIYLRTFGGAWQMPSIQSMPGVFLLREGMFLSADFQWVADSIHQDSGLTDDEKREALLAYLTRYFENDVTGGNITDAFVDNFVRFRTEPTGPRAEWLGFLLDYLTTQVVSQSSQFFSVQNLKSVGRWATARLGSWDIDAERTQETLNQIYFNQYIDRPEVWEFMLEGSTNEETVARSPRNHLHAGYLYSQTMGDLLLDWFGHEKVSALLTTLVDRYQGRAFTYEDLNGVANELGMPLREVFGDWLHEIRPAGFIASTFRVERLPDASDGSPVFEHMFHVQNREKNAGLFYVSYEFVSPGAPTVLVSRSTHPIRLEGDSSVRISIHAEAPIDVMRVTPYFSLNRSSFRVLADGGPDIPSVFRDPAPLTQASDWKWDLSGRIYVDDLDPGFTVDPLSNDTDSRFTVRMISLGQTDPELVSTDRGLRVYDRDSNGNVVDWTRQVVDSSFGLYRRTLVRAEHNSTPRRAHFSTELPHTGSWTLYYHLPSLLDPGDNLFNTRGRDRLTRGGRVMRPNLDISVTQSVGGWPAVAPGKDLIAGWNRIGTFQLETGEVKVSVSTGTSIGTVVADAIFWQYAGSSAL